MNSPDNVYFDVLLTNNIQNNSGPIPAYYSTSRTMPLIQDTTGYALSIIRFSMDTPYLPVFAPQIQSNQSDINLTTYSITLSYTNSQNQTIYYQQYMEYIPQDKSATLPSAPNANPYGLQNNSTGYYWVYSYQYLCYLVNNTFDMCYANLQTLAEEQNMTLPTNRIPVMSYNVSTQLASIGIDGNYGVNTGQIQIYFNNALFELFNSFPATYYNYNAKNGMNYIINNQLANNTLTLTQEISTIANWSPVRSIVFSTSLLPIIPSQMGLPSVYNNGIAINSSSNNNSFNVITDLVADNFQFIPFIMYAPTSEYRFIDLLENQKISSLDVSVYWSDRFGSLYPMLLSSNSTLSMKFLFTKYHGGNFSKLYV
jgi:hypothetical protein